MRFPFGGSYVMDASTYKGKIGLHVSRGHFEGCPTLRRVLCYNIVCRTTHQSGDVWFHLNGERSRCTIVPASALDCVHARELA